MTLFLPKKNSKYGLTVEEGLVKTTPDAHLILDSFSLPQGPCRVARSLRALWTPAVLRRVSASSREGADLSPRVRFGSEEKPTGNGVHGAVRRFLPSPVEPPSSCSAPARGDFLRHGHRHSLQGRRGVSALMRRAGLQCAPISPVGCTVRAPLLLWRPPRLLNWWWPPRLAACLSV